MHRRGDARAERCDRGERTDWKLHAKLAVGRTRGSRRARRARFPRFAPAAAGWCRGGSRRAGHIAARITHVANSIRRARRVPSARSSASSLVRFVSRRAFARVSGLRARTTVGGGGSVEGVEALARVPSPARESVAMTESTRDGTYLKLPVKRYAPKTIRETAEGRYWRAYKSTGLVNQVSQVASVPRGRLRRWRRSRPPRASPSSARRAAAPRERLVRLSAPRRPPRRRQDARRRRPAGLGPPLLRHELAIRPPGSSARTPGGSSRSRSPHDHATLCSGSDDTTVRVCSIGAGACARRHERTHRLRALRAGHASSADGGPRDPSWVRETLGTRATRRAR